jgi:hypothetical protein
VTLCKVKVKISLGLINYAPLNDVVGGMEVYPPFLTSALDGGEWSASRPCRSTPGETDPDTHFIEGWMVPRARLDVALPGIEPRLGRPARILVAIPVELSQLYDII